MDIFYMDIFVLMGKNIVLIGAAGTGTRFGGDVPKQYININSKPVMVYTLEQFQNCKDIDIIAVTCKKEYISFVEKIKEQYNINKLQYVIEGGNTAQESRFNGLKTLMEKGYGEEAIVLIHDAVRPFISLNSINQCINKTKESKAALCGIKINASILTTNNEFAYENGESGLNQVIGHMPQGYYLKDIYMAYAKNKNKWESTAGPSEIAYCEGIKKFAFINLTEKETLKITKKEDLELFNNA